MSELIVPPPMPPVGLAQGDATNPVIAVVTAVAYFLLFAFLVGLFIYDVIRKRRATKRRNAAILAQARYDIYGPTHERTETRDE